MARKLQVITGARPDDADGMPSDLGPDGTALWRSVMREYAVTDVGGRALLVQLCRATDRAERCRVIIDREGEIVQTPHGPREHALLKPEATCRSLVARLIRALGLDVEPIRPMGRPPASLYGGGA